MAIDDGYAFCKVSGALARLAEDDDKARTSRDPHQRNLRFAGSNFDRLIAEAPLGQAIADECDDIKRMLLEKNIAYGNSALDPVRVFSKASLVEQILVRLDDKLSRMQRGTEAGEDVEKDLMGYLVLLRIAKRQGK